MYKNIHMYLKMDEKSARNTYMSLYVEAPIVLPFSKSRKKIAVVKGAMSTNGYENVSPGARFLKAAASQQPFMSVTGVPIFFLVSRGLEKSAYLTCLGAVSSPS